MKRIRIIEMPKEEVRLDALEKALISAGSNCESYSPCKTEQGTTGNKCLNYNTVPCGGCGGALFCASYIF